MSWDAEPNYLLALLKLIDRWFTHWLIRTLNNANFNAFIIYKCKTSNILLILGYNNSLNNPTFAHKVRLLYHIAFVKVRTCRSVTHIKLQSPYNLSTHPVALSERKLFQFLYWHWKNLLIFRPILSIQDMILVTEHWCVDQSGFVTGVLCLTETHSHSLRYLIEKNVI